MTFVAVRGATRIEDETELQAHLASLLRLENIGLLLGAGASVGAGGQTMMAMWDRFVATYPDDAAWMVEHGFIDAVAIGEPHRELPNIERVIDRLEIALFDWERRLGDGGGFAQFAEEINDLKGVRASLYRAIVNAAILQERWWISPSGVESDELRLETHRVILQKLVAARQPGQSSPWVFTTNYDLAVEWAAESIDLQVVNGFLGTHSRRFSPQSFDLGFRNIQARGEARFGVYNLYLAKLHGSLTWQESGGQVYELPAKLAHECIRAFLDADAGEELGLMVMPRAAKYMETVGFVLGELFRRFAEFMSRPQTCLILNGYGFGDEHINRLLRSALLNPTLQLVIYFPGFDGNIAAPELPASLRKLISLRSPRVTIVGGNERAFLSALAEQLPDPVMFDEEVRRFHQELVRRRDELDEEGNV